MYSLIKEDDVILTKKCDYINPNKTDLDLYLVAKSMFEIMYANNGIGLAAPQIGLPIRLFIIGTSSSKLLCINPKIIKCYGEKSEREEGCLTFPDKFVNVKRYDDIKVAFQTIDNKVVKLRLNGILARAYQHELDHLNGVVFLSKAT